MRTKFLRAVRDGLYASHLPEIPAVILRPFCHRILTLDAAEARRQLEQFSPCPDGTAAAKHRLIEPPRYDLQVVVNVYNLERYIRECADSILQQETSYSFRVIFVDDGSKDASPEILDTYTADPRVKVIHQNNVGQSSKNTGLELLDSAYVLFVDGDDMLEQGSIQAMLDEAYQRDADIVQIGLSRLEEGHIDRQKNVNVSREAPPYGELTGFACGKVIRSRLFETVQFPPGFWHADTIISFLIHPMAVGRYRIPAYGYIYRCKRSRTGTAAVRWQKCSQREGARRRR